MENKHKSWAFAEAYKLAERFEAGDCRNPYVLFETGYGPSGLPHIGTFGEVARTSMVMCALKTIAPHIPAKLICFSDDMDGLRKIPDNLPNPERVS
jgi:lysyl-tRNA synthetase, class I